MKSSFRTVFAAAAFVVLGACGGAEEEEIEPVETVPVVPAPAPAPMPDTMMMDTTMMHGDSMMTTTGQ